MRTKTSSTKLPSHTFKDELLDCLVQSSLTHLAIFTRETQNFLESINHRLLVKRFHRLTLVRRKRKEEQLSSKAATGPHNFELIEEGGTGEESFHETFPDQFVQEISTIMVSVFARTNSFIQGKKEIFKAEAGCFVLRTIKGVAIVLHDRNTPLLPRRLFIFSLTMTVLRKNANKLLHRLNTSPE